MKTVLITGATTGFGNLMVKVFLESGHRVIATGRNITKRREALTLMRELFPQDSLIELDLDVTSSSEGELALYELKKRKIPLDILINNAGSAVFGALEELEETQIRAQMEVNFFGQIRMIQLFLPLLRESKGMIFNVSSVFGFMGFPLTSMYCASKFAIEGLTESLRGELAPQGIQVCLIEPGGYKTNFTQNINWVGATPKHSEYKIQYKNYATLHKGFEKKTRQNPLDVAYGVLSLSQRQWRRLPMRKVFGKDACLSYVSRKFLPEFVYYKILDFCYKFIFQKK